MARPGRHRLAMDIPIEIQKEIMENAKLHNITITRWILQAIWERLKKEREYE